MPAKASVVARRMGLSYRQLDHWARTGVLRPHVAANGSGSRREFDDDEVRVAVILSRLCRLLCGTVVTRHPPVVVLAAIADAVRGDPATAWLRIDEAGVTPVAHPVSDGALYLSVRPAAAMLAPRVEAV